MTMIISGSTGLEFPDGSDQTTAFTNVSPTFTGTVAVEALTASGNVNFDSNTLFVDSVNNEVGIGTSSPVSTLDVTISSATAYSATASGTAFRVANINSSAATNFSSMQLVTDGNGRGIVNLNALNNAAAASADFSIQTRHNGTLGERLRITSDGNVGIGTTSASNGMALARGAGVQAFLDLGGNGNAPTSAGMAVGQWQNSEAYCWNRANASLLFGTNNAERMRIDSSGNVLVGTTTNPDSAKFHVQGREVVSVTGSDSFAGTLYFSGNGSSNPFNIQNTASGGLAFWGYNGGWAERFRIGTSGQLGIGGANYGTSGQVLKSNGSGSAPSWGSGGKVLQVLQAVSTTQQSTSSRSMIDVSGMSVSITPSSTSSKILVIVDLKGGAGYQGYIGTQLLRNATIIYSGVGTGQFLSFTYTTSGDAEGRYSVYQLGGTYLDSPATTSAITYKLQYQASVQGTAYINRSEAQDSAAGCTASSITVMEIAG